MVSQAQDCSSIRGIVVDGTTGELMPGASVLATKSDAGQLTSPEGTFSLEAARGDTLVVTFMGYSPQVFVIDGCEVKVLLRPAATEITAVVVEAEKLIAEEFVIRKLKKLDVYTNPSARADPLLAVNAMPFATTTDESANVSLRGSSPAETGVFLNDVPIDDAVRYSQLNGIGAFSLFNTALIAEVQIYPGNPPLEFGNSTSGVISLYSDEVLPARPSTQLAASLAGLSSYHSRRLSERSSLTLYTNWQSSWLFTQVNARALGGVRTFFSADFGAHYFFRLSPTLSLKIFNYTLRESYRYHYTHPTLEGIFNQDRLRNFTTANLRKKWGRFTIDLNQGLSLNTAKFAFSTLALEVPLESYYGALNVRYAAPHYQWKTGIVYEGKSQATSGSYPVYSYAFGEAYGRVSVSDALSYRQLEWFAYYKYLFGNGLSLGGGLRKNLAHRDIQYTSWQLNANVRPGRRWNITLSAGDFHKYILRRSANSEGYLLSSRQYSADFNWKSRKLEIAASVFHKQISRDAAREKVAGAELFGRYKFSESWRTQLSLTSLSAHNEKGMGTPYNIGYFIRGNVEYKIQGVWTFSLVFLFRQGSYYYPVDATVYHNDTGLFEPLYAGYPSRLPTYNNIDFSASRIFMMNARTTAIAFFNVGNVGNFRNVRGYEYNFDYTAQRDQLFSRRVVYFGLVLSW